ncbi:MAG: virulence-associated E family protein [Prevotellaceae bacterium]|nr:virulence-associated E family protein [Prevotellaceae bacterium]
MKDDWKKQLVVDTKGCIVHSIGNLRVIFTNDENLSKIRYDTFCQDDVSFTPLFLNVNGNKVDEESVGKIQDHLEQEYNLRLTQSKVFEILKTTATERSFNPVQDFIRQVEWDGIPRIATSLIDYLGAEDTPLVMEQTKLWYVGAVARAFEPGCKFDNVLTLPGPQGIGKSTFFKTIGGDWFSDSFSFASGDKEKVEIITNGWIIEISELNGMKRANDAEAAKAFLSRCSDYMRPAYGHKVVEFKRHNVFAATTNETNFLQGDNGNRRWWIVPVNGNGHVSAWLSELKAVVPQLWAEAYAYYKQGMKLYLPPELENQANEVQMNHSNVLVDPILEDIVTFLEHEVPKAYATWPIPTRLAYQKGCLTGSDSYPEETLNMVCARQIIEELPNELIRKNPAKYTSQYINRLMSFVDGWERSAQEKVKGLHPAYCDGSGRAKHPWVRIGQVQQKEKEGREETMYDECPF